MAHSEEPEQPTPSALADALGGPLGLAETSLPAVAFALTYAVSGSSTNTAAAVAVAIAVVLTVARLVRRTSPRHAITGLVGVAFAAFVAARSGRAENYFLPGLLANAAYAGGCLVSIVIGRPIVGVIVSQLEGEGGQWRQDPRRMRTFIRASWLWTVLFATRLAVQLPLYLAGAVVALGIARTAMGLPLFALGVWMTWRLVNAGRTEPRSAG